MKSKKKTKKLVSAKANLKATEEVKVSKDRFDSVPPETWLLAFRYLSRKDLLQLLLVSSFFRQLAEQYIYERIVANFTHQRLSQVHQRSLACLQSIKNRPQAAAAVRWLDIIVPKTEAGDAIMHLKLITDVLASVEKLHLLRLYGMGDILPKDLKQGCLQYLKAYRGAPGSLASRGELPAVIELGYFEDVERWSDDYAVPWPDIILGLPTNFPNLKTLSLGSFYGINDDLIKALTAILPVLPLERLDLVNFTPLPVSEELAHVQSFHSLCPTIRSVRLSSYNGDWRYLPQYEVWTTEDYDQRKLEKDARAKKPMSDQNRVTLPDTVKRLWNAAEVKLRFPRQ